MKRTKKLNNTNALSDISSSQSTRSEDVSNASVTAREHEYQWKLEGIIIIKKIIINRHLKTLRVLKSSQISSRE